MKDAFKTVQNILEEYIDSKRHLVFIFGSRASGDAKQWSGIDVGIAGPRLNPGVYFSIVEAFDDSNLPYIVDFVELADVGGGFLEVALQSIVPLNFVGGIDEIKRALSEP